MAGEATPEKSAMSRDPQLGALLSQLEEGADAAFAASAFRTLMTTLPASNDGVSWELPVSVSVPAGAADPLSSKIVFIDKPLIPRSSTLRRKHEILYKSALVTLSAAHDRGMPRSPTGGDTAGDHVPAHAGTGSAKAAEQGSGDVSKVTETPRLPLAAADLGGEPAARPDIRQPGGGQPQQEVHRGVRYDLWRIGGFRAIIRSHSVAYINGSQRRAGHLMPGSLVADQQAVPVIARAKVEYTANEQVSHLHERHRDIVISTPDRPHMAQFTDTELSSWRALLHLQPEAVLMLARVAVLDSTLLRTEQLRCQSAKQLAYGSCLSVIHVASIVQWHAKT